MLSSTDGNPTTDPSRRPVMPAAATCVQCGQPSGADRTFCGGCGARLWEPCLDCGERNQVSQGFCAKCGADLANLVHTALAELDRMFEQAAELEQQGKLLEAVECLKGVAASEHSQIAARVEQATSRRTELRQRRDEMVARRQTVFTEAQQLHGERYHQQAYELLEGVPASLRDQQMRALLDTLIDLVARISQLRAELKRSLKDGDPHRLLAIAEELHELEPHAADIARLCPQLRQRCHERDKRLAARLLKQARAAIAANNYAVAGKCLDKMPAGESGIDPKLLAAVEERVWLARQLRLAPFADRRLLTLATRLAKLQPTDQQAEQARQQIAARIGANRKAPGASVVPWRPMPEHPRLGAPVVLADAADRFLLAANSGRPPVPPEHARRHLVGLGLALHGLGASRLRMELEPAATGSAWRIRLSDLGWSRQARSVWALDFGTSGLKVLRLVREKDAITLRNATIIPYVDATIAAESTNLQSCYAPALAAFLEQYKPADEPLVVGFSGTQSFGRFFTLPSVARKKVQALVTYEVRNQIPVSLDDVVYATHVIEHEVDASGLVQARVALVAANRALVDLRSSVFSDSSGRVRAFQSDCVALLNTLLHCYQDEFAQLAADEALALVDVGDAATNVVVASPTHGPWFRTVHRGVRSLNKLLVSKFGLTWQQADQLRQTWKAAESLAELDRVLLPGLESLTREVKLALDASRAAMQCRIAKIYVAGGGSEQFGLLREWSQPASQETGNSGGRVREPQSDSAAVTSKESA